MGRVYSYSQPRRLYLGAIVSADNPQKPAALRAQWPIVSAALCTVTLRAVLTLIRSCSRRCLQGLLMGREKYRALMRKIYRRHVGMRFLAVRKMDCIGMCTDFFGSEPLLNIRGILCYVRPRNWITLPIFFSPTVRI